MGKLKVFAMVPHVVDFKVNIVSWSKAAINIFVFTIQKVDYVIWFIDIAAHRF